MEKRDLSAFAAKNVYGWLRACCIYFASPHISLMANDVAAVFESRASTGVSPISSLGTLRSCGLQLCSALCGLSLALLCCDIEIPLLLTEQTQ